MPSLKEQKLKKNGSKNYWRSLDELADTPEFRSFVEREFPEQASELKDRSTRRQFLKIMGASLAFAGVTSCRWPKEKIVPYASRPEGRIPGVPERFATAMELSGVASGLLVTSYDGRPIKVEGNPSHSYNHGTADVLSQAAILEIYDPDRSKGIVRRDDNKDIAQDWDSFLSQFRSHFNRLKEQKGEGLYILSETTSSPSVEMMRQRLEQAFPQSKWYEYEPISNDNERAGAQTAFGTSLRTHLNLDKAKVILSLDSDFLISHPAALKYSRDYAKGRQVEQNEMNRLYVVESRYSTTGAMADHRFPVPSKQILHFLCAVASRIVSLSKDSVPAEYKPIVHKLSQLSGHPFDQKMIEVLAKDLTGNTGQCVITIGDNQPPAVHALAHWLNFLLGNIGKTVSYTQEINPNRLSYVDALHSLIQEIENGAVDTLLIFGGNPVYDAPADFEFGGYLSKIQNSVHLSLYDNETSHACNWHVPRAHFLESWGDARAYDGTICSVQPLIEPLYNGKSVLEFLAVVLDEAPQTGYEIVRRTYQTRTSEENFESFWKRFLHDGILPNSRFGEFIPDLQIDEIHSQIAGVDFTDISAERSAMEITFHRDSCVYDGRFANNGWLQELPDFMTKIAWDNAALISPVTAEELRIQNQEIIRIEVNGRSLEMPVYIMPGQAPNSMALFLGYGRQQAGNVGNDVGFNTYVLRTSGAMDIVTDVKIEPAGRFHDLACTQDHHAIDTVGLEAKQHRIGELVREANLEEYKKHPDFAHHRVHAAEPVNLWTEHQYNDHKWGMTIDLNSCIGCNACVTACQAENNIPIVGKEQVANGREMHWIRIDRYFKGNSDNPQVAHQPLACVHCENAPCEQVCPVAATVHSHEGLNLMVYNRCVGTRYCSNNCPYKVRRFNFFNYRKNLSETEKMAFNPEVTVRSRGVMEKCTYCVQRIEAAKITAKNEKRPIEDGEIKTACQQTCPTQAIVFGDLNDKNSKVARLQEEKRAYGMLAEINTKPRTFYLARVRNPNPELIEGEPENADEHNSHS